MVRLNTPIMTSISPLEEQAQQLRACNLSAYAWVFNLVVSGDSRTGKGNVRANGFTTFSNRRRKKKAPSIWGFVSSIIEQEKWRIAGSNR